MSEARPDATGVLAILVKRFPRLSETFVLNEVLELERQGIPLRLHAVLDPMEPKVQPEAEALRSQVQYLRSDESVRGWMRMFPAAGAVAWRHPRGTARAVAFAVRRHSIATWKHLGEALVLVGQLEREGAKHLHAHFAHGPAAIAHLVHLVLGTPYSFTAHAKDLYTTPRAYVAARGRTARFVVTCTEANRGYLAELLGDAAARVMVCRHGVNLERFGGLERQPVPGRILSIGRLVPKKGFDVLVRALAQLDDRRIPFHCRIVGGGPLESHIKDLVASLGLADRVSLLPSRPQDALAEEFVKADVFALAPRVTKDGDRDGIPNVLLEAMAAGVPVVSTAISGIPEIVQPDRTGLLVPPEDPAALADALAALLCDRELNGQVGEQARRWALENCDPEESVKPLAARFAESLWPATVT